MFAASRWKLCGWWDSQINKPIYNISAPAVLFPYLDDQKQWLTFHWHCLKNKMWWHYLDAFVVLVGPDKCWRSRLFFFYEGEPRLPISTLPLFLPLDEVDKKQIIVLIGLFTKLHRHLFIRESSNSFQPIWYHLNAWTILKNKQERTNVCASWQWRGKASHCQLSFSTNGGWVCHCHFQTVTRHHHHLNHFAH